MLEGQSAWRAERAAKDARCSRLGVEVAVALRERDTWVAQCEQRAAAALAALTDGEGLSVAEALRWCGGLLSGPEVARLRRLSRLAAVEVVGEADSGQASSSPTSSGSD
ncbi:hypothetical protein [Arthrobacter sp. NEB 688]|uniref:hypothetical protein n=1 Tax=Arthrobacter sp. NEB 688 TaxID=904039 RepID=UPI00156614F6|nr:hypothetical protein [Arthrobacter sp. NEB 688]QKE85107.1 hypothetical protein HL663_14970 [Arthrobacter sp. NEB 688]